MATHHFTGQSHLFDHERSVLLANKIRLHIERGVARVEIGAIADDGHVETVTFTRPASVTTLAIIASILEQHGVIPDDLEPIPDDTPASPPRATWEICPKCERRGWNVDNHGNWHECDVCDSAGLVRVDVK